MNYSVRQAIPEDAAIIASMALKLAVLEQPTTPLCEDALQLLTEEIEHEIRIWQEGSGSVVHLVGVKAPDPMNVVGCLALAIGENSVPFTGTYALGYNLFVMEAYRGTKVAAFLLQTALGLAREFQVDECSLTVDLKRDGVPEATYTRMGFKPDSTRYTAKMSEVQYGVRR